MVNGKYFLWFKIYAELDLYYTNTFEKKYIKDIDTWMIKKSVHNMAENPQRIVFFFYHDNICSKK